MTIGTRIKNIRQNVGLSQRAFAKRIGVNYVTLNKYETGKMNPGSQALLRILDEFDLPPNMLFPENSIQREKCQPKR